MDEGIRAAAAAALCCALAACGEPYVERPPAPAPPDGGIYGFANGCYAIDATPQGVSNTRWLAASGDTSFAFSALSVDAGARFVLRPSDLGTYLLYDDAGRYLV